MELNILTIVVVCLIASFLIGELFVRMKYPRLIGQIISGIILGHFMLSFFTPRIMEVIDFLAELGIIFLLLIVGLELDLEKFKKAGKDSTLIAIFCFLLPFTLGFVLLKSFGASNLAAVVVGACLGITAEATTLKLLVDMDALNTRIGNIILGAGIIDDVFENVFLLLVLVLAGGHAVSYIEHSSTLISILLRVAHMLVFILIIYILYKVMPRILDSIQKEKSRVATFSAVLIIALIIALVSKTFVMSPIIGALVAGIIINLTERDREEEHEMVKELKLMTFSLIIPFFFIKMGLTFRIANLLQNIWITIIIIVVAIVGKIFGALIAKPFTDLTTKQTYLIGWGMNSRGAMELIIASIAFEGHNTLISNDIYSAIVAMAVITTLIFPFAFKYYIKKDRSILY